MIQYVLLRNICIIRGVNCTKDHPIRINSKAVARRWRKYTPKWDPSKCEQLYFIMNVVSIFIRITFIITIFIITGKNDCNRSPVSTPLPRELHRFVTAAWYRTWLRRTAKRSLQLAFLTPREEQLVIECSSHQQLTKNCELCWVHFAICLQLEGMLQDVHSQQCITGLSRLLLLNIKTLIWHWPPYSWHPE